MPQWGCQRLKFLENSTVAHPIFYQQDQFNNLMLQADVGNQNLKDALKVMLNERS
jgi:hypothetical protein